jgi:diaminopimelate epimerase
MRFWKYHGIGNDFILVEDFLGSLLDCAPALAEALCHRNFGIGGDGLVLITQDQGLYTMRIFNPDGTEAEMCGNAIRCVADHLFVQGYAAGETLYIDTLSGVKEISRVGDLYAVDMGEPQFSGADLPSGGAQAVETSRGSLQVYPVSMGNPHGVVFVDDLPAADFSRLGPVLEKHPMWPAHANIEFVGVQHATALQVKVWERGAGPTLACGTGACAAAVWAARLGLAERQVTVQLPGGHLQIRWEDNNHVWMIGPAVRVFEGYYHNNIS